MADGYSDVRSDLRTLLLTVSGLPAVAWESRSYTPKVGVAYIEERLMPLGSPVATQGTTGWIREEFTYHLVLFSPMAETGLFEHEDLVGEIRKTFYPGYKIGGGINTYAGIIEEARRGPVDSEPDWRSTDIDVDGYFHRSARVA